MLVVEQNSIPGFHATSMCDIERSLLIRNYLSKIDNNSIIHLTPDECHPESLHAASGRIMLEERTSFIPMVAKAIEFYLCDDTMFHVQLWEPMEGRKYKLVWSKDIIPDENSGGGYRRTVCESPIFILLSMLLPCPEFHPIHLLLPNNLLNAKVKMILSVTALHVFV